MSKEEIIMISSNTRRRKIKGEWKLERKDPIKGVWCIHPIQFFHDNQETMMEMYEEIDKESRQIEKELYDPEKLRKIMEDMEVAPYLKEQYDIDFDKMKIVKVVHVKHSGGFKESNSLVIFDAMINNKKERWMIESGYDEGDFYQPPDSGWELQKLQEAYDVLPKYATERKEMLKEFLEELKC